MAVHCNKDHVHNASLIADAKAAQLLRITLHINSYSRVKNNRHFSVLKIIIA